MFGDGPNMAAGVNSSAPTNRIVTEAQFFPFEIALFRLIDRQRRQGPDIDAVYRFLPFRMGQQRRIALLRVEMARSLHQRDTNVALAPPDVLDPCSSFLLPSSNKRDIQPLQLLPHPHGEIPVDVQADIWPEADQLGQILVPQDRRLDACPGGGGGRMHRRGQQRHLAQAFPAAHYAHRVAEPATATAASPWSTTCIRPSLWPWRKTTLAADDVDEASEARHWLTRAPGADQRTVPFLKRHLNPDPAPDVDRIKQLVAQLDDDSFQTREKAEHELEDMGDLAVAILKRTLEAKPSLEVQRRIERILSKAQLLSREKRQYLRAIDVLEQLATPDAKELLRTLSQGAPGTRVTTAAHAAFERLASASGSSIKPEATPYKRP